MKKISFLVSVTCRIYSDNHQEMTKAFYTHIRPDLLEHDFEYRLSISNEPWDIETSDLCIWERIIDREYDFSLSVSCFDGETKLSELGIEMEKKLFAKVIIMREKAKSYQLLINELESLGYLHYLGIDEPQ